MKDKSFCIANWKMYLNNIESINFIKKFIKYDFSLNNNCEIVICPSFTSIPLLVDLIDNNNITLGSQDASNYEKGAFTGEISFTMLEELNCKWSIVGHSERRQLLGESNDMIAEKLKLLYNKSLIKPIFCIGETLDEMQANKTQYILELQIESGITDLNFNSGQDLLIAYEPVWAIGTGVSADIDTIYKNIKIIKDFIKKFDTKNCNIYLLYGGSVNKDNASEFFSLNEINGFLIGSVSTNPQKFYSIFEQF